MQLTKPDNKTVSDQIILWLFSFDRLLNWMFNRLASQSVKSQTES